MDTTTQWETLLSSQPSFSEKVPSLTATDLTTIQVNIGYRCNQTCSHCHVDASPSRTEMMSEETVEKCLKIIRDVDSIQTVDITGGAPEMHPLFRKFVEESRAAGKEVIDRCNLTILEEPGYENFYDFLAENQVQIVASLPYYSERTTDKQRGKGVFEKSIAALQKLNERGYGENLILNLVYNPNGLFLSPPQEELEVEFKNQLQRKYNIRFNRLFAINNIPVNRFLAALVRTGRFEEYMETLVNAFNPATVEGLMCRHQMSVRYDGSIFDCDFNQMLDRPSRKCAHIDGFLTPRILLSRNIVVRPLIVLAVPAGAGLLLRR